MFACAASSGIVCPVVTDDDLQPLTSSCARVVFPLLQSSPSPQSVSQTITLSGAREWCVTVSQAVNFNFTQFDYPSPLPQTNLTLSLLVTKPGMMDDIFRSIISSVTVQNGAFFPITPVWTFDLSPGTYVFQTTAAQDILTSYPFQVLGEMSVLTSPTTLL